MAMRWRRNSGATPASAASTSALRPRSSTAATSGLASASRASTGAWPPRAVSSSGVRPSASRALRSAPASSSSPTISALPAAQASSSAVRWPLPRESTLALCRSSSCTPAVSSSPTTAASRAGWPSLGSGLAPRSIRKRASRQLPAAQATPSGLKPSWLSASSRAPASSSSAATAGSVLRAAWCRGVLPSASARRASAPLASRVITASGRPCQLSRVAASSGVRPACSALRSAPRAISSRSRRRSPSSAASMGRVRWSRSPSAGSADGSAPACSAASAASMRPARVAA